MLSNIKRKNMRNRKPKDAVGIDFHSNIHLYPSRNRKTYECLVCSSVKYKDSASK